MKQKIIVVFLLIALLSASTFAFAVSEIERNEEILQEVQDELKELDEEKSQKKYESNEVLNNINTINNEIKAIEREISDLNGLIKDTEVKIEEKIASIEQTQMEIDEKQYVLEQRLRVMYKSGNAGYLEVILGAANFEDLLSRMDMLQRIYIHDKNLIEDLINQKILIEEEKAELEAYVQDLGVMKQSLNAKTETLAGSVAKLQTEQRKLQSDIKAIEAQEDALEEDAKRISDIIKNLELEATYVGGEMAWPAPGYYTITSAFGYRIHPILNTKKLHTGVDIAVPANTEIKAAQSGKVIYSDWLGGYGKVVMIDHGGGIVTLYAHNNKLLVDEGETVQQGQAITKSGSTGMSTGPHLHFEVRENGEYVDPMGYVKAKN